MGKIVVIDTEECIGCESCVELCAEVFAFNEAEEKAEVILPEGYNGKILLVSVSGDGIEKSVLLRSGDLWHREILRNTEAEIKNLGFENARVHELGGALASFEANGAITIYGASEEFGACDKEYAAEIIKKNFRDRAIKIRD